MRFAGDVSAGDKSDTSIAADYGDRIRQREEAKILYKMIMDGALGDPLQHKETLMKLQDQISGVRLGGV